MTLRNGFWTMLGLMLVAGTTFGQTEPWRGSAPQQGPVAGPNQPVQPQTPTLQRRAPAAQPVPPQFQLTQQQQVYVDWALNVWEQHGAKIKTFECKFVRWEHDRVFGPANQAKFEDLGVVKYGAPDRGMFRVDQTKVNGEWQAIPEERSEHWICDGKAIFEFKSKEKKIFEYKLPPEAQGKAIANGPLPFLFGSTAASIKRRYFIRPVTPPDLHKTQIWLEAYPRFQQDAADYKKATIILTVDKLEPHALRLELPSGNSEVVYRFYDIVVNDPLGFLKGNPFTARTPLGWTFVPDNGPSRVTQQPSGGSTR